MPFSFYEHTSLYLALLLGVSLVAVTGEVQAPYWLAAMAAIAAGYWGARGQQAPWLASATLATVIVVVFSVANWLFLSVNYLIALIDLVLLLLVLKLLGPRRVADHLQMLGLSFLLVLAACVITSNLIFGVLLLAYFFSGLLALVLQNLRGHWERAGSEGQVLAQRRGILGRAFGFAIVVLGAGILVFTLCLFFLFPRVGFRGWHPYVASGAGQSGYTDNVRLEDFGRLRADPAIALRVDYPDFLPGEGSPLRRLRGRLLDRFDGHEWTDSAGDLQTVESYRRKVWVMEAGMPLTWVTVMPVAKIGQSFFWLAGVKHVEGEFEKLTRVPTGNVNAVRLVGVNSPYRLGIGSAVSDTAMPPSGRYLEVPPDLSPRVIELAREWSGGLQGKPLAERLTEKLLTSFSYSMEFSLPQGISPIEHFLFTAKAGHCQLFASSLALMLRQLGMPTRIVNGYLDGDVWDAHSVVFRELHAHSWVEAYVENEGWLTFDPTPPSALATSWLADFRTSVNDIVAQARFVWYGLFVSYNSETQISVAYGMKKASDRIGSNINRFFSWRPKAGDAKSRLIGAWAGGLLVTAAAIFGVTLWLRRKRRISASHVGRLYALRLRSAETKHARASGQTPLAFAKELARHDEAWSPFEEYTRLYYKLRYGQAETGEGIAFLNLHARLPKLVSRAGQSPGR